MDIVRENISADEFHDALVGLVVQSAHSEGDTLYILFVGGWELQVGVDESSGVPETHCTLVTSGGNG